MKNAAVALALLFVAGALACAQGERISGEQIWNRLKAHFSHLQPTVQPTERLIITGNVFVVISRDDCMNTIRGIDIKGIPVGSSQWTVANILRLRLQEKFGGSGDNYATIAAGIVWFGPSGHPVHRGWWWGLLALVLTDKGMEFIIIHPFTWQIMEIDRATVQMVIM